MKHIPALLFNSNIKRTLGVEIELQIISPDSKNLTPAGPQILEQLKGSKVESRVKAELFQSMLEIDTPICQDANEVYSSLKQSWDELQKIAKLQQVELMMSGTHPFAHYTERLLTPAGRYFKLLDRNQWIARRLQIFGLHVHIGMKNGEHAIKMSNALAHYLPLILGISSSSPYWQGEDTGLASSRITFFEALPTGGHPYLLSSWKDFEELIHKLTITKSITALKDLWWDIRPNIEFGTIEIRIADCSPTLTEVTSIVAVCHSLAELIDQELETGKVFAPPPEWILRENKWRASRHGINAEIILNSEGDIISLKELWKNLKSNCQKISEKFSYQKYFDTIDCIFQKGTSSDRQRKSFDRHHNLQAVVNDIINEGLSDQPNWK